MEPERVWTIILFPITYMPFFRRPENASTRMLAIRPLLSGELFLVLHRLPVAKALFARYRLHYSSPHRFNDLLAKKGFANQPVPAL